MARAKRSTPQQNAHRPYDQTADVPSRVSHNRIYDQAQERPARRADGYGAEDGAFVPGGARRGFYDRQTDRMRPADPEILSRSTVRSGMQEFGFTIPVHNSTLPQQEQQTKPAGPSRQPGGNAEKHPAAKKATTKKRRAARGMQHRPVQAHPVQPDFDDEDDAPLPITLRQRGQAAKRRAKRRRALLFSVLVVLLVGIWVLIAFVFKISEIKITGSSVYTGSVLTESFGYRAGDNLFTFSKRKTADKMLSALPYLETVHIRRQLPGTVRIEVTGSEEKYCFVQPDGSTVITSPTYKVLRLGSNSGGLLSIRGVTFAAPVPGQILAPQTEEDTTLQTLGEVLTALEADHIKNYSELDVSDPYAITLKCEDRFILQLGTTVELDYKLRLAAQTMYSQLEADATGIIDVSSAGTGHAAYYRPQAVD